MKKVAVGLVMLLALVSCGNESQVENKTKIVAENQKIQVTTSIVPLASIANYIGWEKVEVNNLVGAWASPHNFSLTPQHLISVQKSDIVFLLGIQDIDGFLFKSLSGVKSIALDTGLKVLDATSDHNHSEHAGEEQSENGDEHEWEEHSDEEYDEHDHADEAVHKWWYEEEVNEYQYIIDAQEKIANGEHDHWTDDEHNEKEHWEDDHKEEGPTVSEYLAEEWEWHVHAEASIDPHVWGGRINGLLIAKRIQEELTKLQPSQKAVFEKNYNRFETVLNATFEDFAKKVEWKKQKEFIVFHDAYNYLLFDAWIDAEKKIVFRSNIMSEPGSAKMKQLTDEVTLHGIKQFFVEPQFESKPLTVLAEQNNAQILKLDPLGNSVDAGNYLETISTNLEALTNIYE